MNEKYYLFSPSEFLVMLVLAGGVGCTVGLPDLSVNRDSFVEAVTGLFMRGMLQNDGPGLRPDGDGRLFYEISNARTAVVMSTSSGRTALCYVIPGGAWMSEIMADGYRIKKMTVAELAEWIFDSDALEPAVLTGDDADGSLLEDGDEYGVEMVCLLKLEKYINGGALIDRYEIVREGAITVIHHITGEEDDSALYTQGAMDRVMEDSFSDGRR